jgi:hypothetical protein
MGVKQTTTMLLEKAHGNLASIIGVFSAWFLFYFHFRVKVGSGK